VIFDSSFAKDGHDVLVEYYMSLNQCTLVAFITHRGIISVVVLWSLGKACFPIHGILTDKGKLVVRNGNIV
jgi:hypothetical protein